MYYVTYLHVANLCVNGVVSFRHGELDKQSIMVGSPQLASDRAIHLHGGKIHLITMTHNSNQISILNTLK